MGSARRPGRSAPAVSGKVRAMLSDEFQNGGDLEAAAGLLPRLRLGEEDAGEKKTQELQARVAARAASAASYADRLAVALQRLLSKLAQAEQRRSAGAAPDGAGALVHDVAALVRLERLRLYAEQVLALEQSVGVLEDAAASTATTFWDRKFALPPPTMGEERSDGTAWEAVETLRAVEAAVGSIAASGSAQHRLVWAVELRLDRAAAALRMAATAEFRASLAALGWPPPLTLGGGGDTTAAPSNDAGYGVNPLLRLATATNSPSSTRFRDSFSVLSVLQALQQQRRARRRRDQVAAGRKASLHELENSGGGAEGDHFHHEPLWAMEELVSPLASQAEPHFRKWAHKPELVCALAHTKCRELVDAVDELLQPLVDGARLAGYSVREEWVSCLSGLARSFFKSHVLPGLALDVEEETSGPATASLWLHTADQILAFDARMKALLVQGAGVGLGLADPATPHRIGDVSGSGLACVCVFADQPEWLTLWAGIEFDDARAKLALALGADDAWLPPKGPAKQASGAVAALAAMWAVIDRCRGLPDAEHRLTFVRGAAAPLAKAYHDELLWRCDHGSGLVDPADEAEMQRVAVCVNAAHFFELKLQEWSEDSFFLELRLADLCQGIRQGLDYDVDDARFEELGASILEGTIFDKEIDLFAEFREFWVGQLVSVVTRKFEMNCKHYAADTRSWLLDGGVANHHEDTDAAPSGVSGTLVEALHALRRELQVLSGALEEESATDVHRRLMAELDALFVSALLPRGAAFSQAGARQLAADVAALFQVFKPFCLRPSSFFKGLSGAVKATSGQIQ